MLTKPEFTQEKLLTVTEAANILNLKPSTLYRIKQNERSPKRVKVCGRLYFTLSSINNIMG
ncbi:MAG: helix-turn-helix domain-containing protein [Alphaproteobacteria bacterium]|nr:helix-turn-helix domain-containing protein [Alphaproteobacteria bacterium]